MVFRGFWRAIGLAIAAVAPWSTALRAANSARSLLRFVARAHAPIFFRRPLLLLKHRGLLREFGRECLKRRRVRRRRLHVYSTDPRRPQGDLFDRD